MAETVGRPFGSPGRGVHSAWCRCGHEACDHLKFKDDQWCCHWFFLYWVPSRAMMPTEVLRMLRHILRTTEFDYFGSPTSTGAFRVLVYVDNFAVLDADRFDLIPRSGDFVVKECQAWRLTCCQEALVADWNYWRNLLKETNGHGVFWKSRRGGGGNRTVAHDLTDQVTKKIGYSLGNPFR